ncbi:MAG: hypothetical protein Q7J65_08450 [Candidatus Marinimicrobia bacterium]|nr:hypothetical protein [Candidatus Neomarinimicrobiota bacterium]
MLIRVATKKDNQALLDLSRQAPMDAKLVVNNDRNPDYFYLDDLLGEKPVIFVAEKNSRIIGTVGVVFRTVEYKGKAVSVAYIGGIKIENPSQNTLLTFRLMKHVMDYLMDTPVKLGFILVIGANRAMEALLSGRAGIPAFDLVSNYQVKNIFPLPLLRPGKKYSLRTATKTDIPEMAELYRTSYGGYELGPNWTADYLSSLYEQQDFKLENTCLAIHNDTIVAAISLWDQSQFKNTVISRYGGKFAFLKKIASPLRLAPPEGHPLSELFIRHLAFEEGYQDAAAGLLKWVIRNNRRKYRFFRCGYPLNSPQAEIFDKFWGLSIPVNFYSVFKPGDPDRDDMVSHLRQSLVWEDLSLH